MIRSETEQNAATTTVTFTLAHAGLDGQRVAVVGEFNDWDPTATPMDHLDGVHTATMNLPPGRYRFRYLAEGGRWFNDEAAHDYAENEHGGQDSVLDLTSSTLPGEEDLGPEMNLVLEADQSHARMPARRTSRVAKDKSSR